METKYSVKCLVYNGHSIDGPMVMFTALGQHLAKGQEKFCLEEWSLHRSRGREHTFNCQASKPLPNLYCKARPQHQRVRTQAPLPYSKCPPPRRPLGPHFPLGKTREAAAGTGLPIPPTHTHLALTHPCGLARRGLRGAEPAGLISKSCVGQQALQDRHAGLPVPRPGHGPRPQISLGLLGAAGTDTGLGCSLSSLAQTCPTALALAGPGPTPSTRLHSAPSRSSCGSGSPAQKPVESPTSRDRHTHCKSQLGLNPFLLLFCPPQKPLGSSLSPCSPAPSSLGQA